MIQLLPSAGHPVPVQGETLALPPELQTGLQTVTVDQQVWRLSVRTLDSGARIAVAQQTASRDEVARDSAIRTLTPFIFLIPVLLVVGALVRGMFTPSKR